LFSAVLAILGGRALLEGWVLSLDIWLPNYLCGN
jgi:hypothetical protein